MRQIFALPDNIYNSESIGSNRLIKNGANIYLNKEQLLIENGYERLADNSLAPNVSIELDELEIQIIEMLNKESKSLEELSELLNIDKMDLLGKLSLMELESKVAIKGSLVSSG